MSIKTVEIFYYGIIWYSQYTYIQLKSHIYLGVRGHIYLGVKRQGKYVYEGHIAIGHVTYSMVSAQQTNLSVCDGWILPKQHHFSLRGPYQIIGTSSQCQISYGYAITILHNLNNSVVLNLKLTPWKINNINCCIFPLFRSGWSYFEDKINYVEWLYILFALLIVPFRVLNHPGQWIVASLAYFLHGLKIFDFITLFK